MTDQERAEAIELAIKERKETIAARKAQEIKDGYLNPFGECTTYPEFLEQVGKKTIAEYCKGKVTDEELSWLEADIKLFNKK